MSNSDHPTANGGPYKQVCVCGHAKETHYFDAKGPGACLGMRCDDCKCYRDALFPETWPPPAPIRTKARVAADDEDEGPRTDPMPPSRPVQGNAKPNKQVRIPGGYIWGWGGGGGAGTPVDDDSDLIDEDPDQDP